MGHTGQGLGCRWLWGVLAGLSTQLAPNEPLRQAMPPHLGLLLSGRSKRRRDAGHG